MIFCTYKTNLIIGLVRFAKFYFPLSIIFKYNSSTDIKRYQPLPSNPLFNILSPVQSLACKWFVNATNNVSSISTPPTRFSAFNSSCFGINTSSINSILWNTKLSILRNSLSVYCAIFWIFSLFSKTSSFLFTNIQNPTKGKVTLNTLTHF